MLSALLLTATFLAGCDDKRDITAADNVMRSISIAPNPHTLGITQSHQFTATGINYVSGEATTVQPVWSVVAGGGTISSTGLFTAGMATGSFPSTIKASYQGIDATASIVVTVGPLVSIVITPQPASVVAGSTRQFVASGVDAAGNPVTFTPTWSIIAGGGSIGSTGIFTAGPAAGVFPATIRASSGAISAVANVTVTAGTLANVVVTPNPATLAIGAAQTFTATGTDAFGNVLPIIPLWSVAAGGGTITPVTGVFTAGTVPGTFTNTVRAESGGITGAATVNVTAGPLATIMVTPNPATLLFGATQQFTATGRDAAGNVVPVSATWSVAGGGGTISATGMFTAGTTTGTFTNTVRATSGALSGSATVIVVAPAPVLATITVTPNPATMAVNGTQQFTAVGRDSDGAVMAISPTWSVTNGGGTISAGGMFTAGSNAGTFSNTVRATSGGISGNATVVVTPTAPSLAAIIVTPDPAAVLRNGTRQFVATGRDENGNIVNITPVWSVTNGGGTINAASGLFTAGDNTGTFNNTVRATAGGLSGNATVVVTAAAPVVTSITVLPDPATVLRNENRQFRAVGRDADGNVIDVDVTWSVTNGGGTINANSGMFTAGGATGTFNNTVRAASGGVSGNATVIVTAVPAVLTTITVTPDPASVERNGTQQFTAVGRDAQGNIMAIDPVWSVINGGGTINAGGRFTAGNNSGTFNNTVRATDNGVSGRATVVVTGGNPPPTINLGRAAPNGIMAGTAVTCVTGGIIRADVSVSPGNTLTGFGPCVITGERHLDDAAARNAQIDLTTAYNTLAGLPCPASNVITANLGGTTKEAGVYCSSSTIGVTGVLTLDGGGDPNAVFVFQAGSSLTTAGTVVLINGAKPENVYWQVGSSATIGTGSAWVGNIIALSSISLLDAATLRGRALARNGAVSLTSGNIIDLP